MSTTKTTLAALAAPTLLLALAACDSQTMTNADREGAAIGQKSNAALADAGDKLKQAGREAEQKLAEASARTQQTLEHGAERLRRATADDAGSGPRDAATASANATSDTASAASASATSGSANATSGGNGASRDARWGDAAITASIKADFLKDPDLSVFKIDVDTKDGVVTLNGLAQDEAARKRAESLAQGIKGVREVRNHLVLKKV